LPVPPIHSKVAAARAIIRSLYALSRHVRLFGLNQERTLAQVELGFARVRSFIPSSGILIALNGDRLNVETVALDITPAEQSFARLLREVPNERFMFDESFSREALERITSAMAFQQQTSPATSADFHLTSAVEAHSWLSDPFALLTFLNSAIYDASMPAPEHSEAGSAEIAPLLHVLRRLGTSEDADEARGAARDLQRVSTSLLGMLREVLLELSEQAPATSGETLLLRTADSIVIRLVLRKLARKEITPGEISSHLERFARQLQMLRAVFGGSEPATVRVGVPLDTLIDNLDRELWKIVPDEFLRNLLLSPDAFYVAPSALDLRLVRMIEVGEDELVAKILHSYGNAVSGREAEGRRRSAKGIAELAEFYALVVPDYVPSLVRSIARQLMRESDPRMQSLLGTALGRLSYAVQQQRDFVATAAASDAVTEILERRPALGPELRPRISIENRLPEYLDEALSSSHASDDLIGLLQRYAGPVTQQLCARFVQSSLREESVRLVNLADRLGSEARSELLRRMRTGNSEEALSSAGLASALLPEETSNLLARSTAHWNQTQQDFLVRQLAIAASPGRSRILLKLLPDLDALIVPGAIDEIGMSEDTSASSALLAVANAGDTSRFSGYSRVKAIEALGRLRAPDANEALLELLQSRRVLHWAQPHEVRIAALQALYMIDPEKTPSLVPKSGITARELSLGPLAVDVHNPWSRQRRYSRVLPTKPVAAVANSNAGRAGLEIISLSLGGGRARRQGKTQAVSESAVQLQFALRRMDSQVLIREQAGSELTFEIADIGLAERSRLRHLLLAQTPSPSPRAA
jgi:hypothetical protein